MTSSTLELKKSRGRSPCLPQYWATTGGCPYNFLKVSQALTWAQKALEERGMKASAFLDAQLLLSQATGLSKEQLYMGLKDELGGDEVQAFLHLLDRRLQGEPMAYITGEKEFMSLPFSVNPDVLVPRPETEMLVEKGLELLKHEPGPLIMDVGTGSGCIAISMAYYLPRAQVYASDISPEALRVARGNAQRLGLEHRITFLRGHGLEPFKSQGLKGKVDLLMANPPYITEEEFATLGLEVRAFEPRLALVGGEDGLGLSRDIIQGASEFLKPMAEILLETSPHLAPEVLHMLSFEGASFTAAETLCDFQGHPRVVLAKRV